MRLVFFSGSLTAVGWPRRSTDDRSSGRLTMLLNGCWGCIVLPFWVTGRFFVLETEALAGAVPTAGEARVLALALGVPPAEGPAAGVDDGIIVSARRCENDRRLGFGLGSRIG